MQCFKVASCNLLRHLALAVIQQVASQDLTFTCAADLAGMRPAFCCTLFVPQHSLHACRRSVMSFCVQLAKENSLSALEQAINDEKKQCDEASANE